MLFGKKPPSLIVTQGVNAGKSIALKKSEVRIGSGDDCPIKVAGRYISPLHAVLRKDADGAWTLENHSVNGTLVNGQSVKTVTLKPGDRIVVGGALEFEFSTDEAAPAKLDEESGDADADASDDAAEATEQAGKQTAKRSGSGKKIALIAGLAVYGVGLVVVAIFLSLYEGGDGGQGALDIQRLEKVLAATRYELAYGAGFTDAEEVACALANRHAGYASARDAAARKAGAGTADPERLRSQDLDRILGEVEQAFHGAWREEMQGRYKAAAGYYREVFEALPGIRFCAARYAASRLRTVTEQED